MEYKLIPKYVLCNTNENLYLSMNYFLLLLVPKVEGREKPIITYEGDRAVMVCKTECNPTAWFWYMNVTNGTGRVRSSPAGQATQCDKKLEKLCTLVQALQIAFPF